MRIVGIETSCDETAIGIVADDSIFGEQIAFHRSQAKSAKAAGIDLDGRGLLGVVSLEDFK